VRGRYSCCRAFVVAEEIHAPWFACRSVARQLLILDALKLCRG
jgi:hypothetical protein